MNKVHKFLIATVMCLGLFGMLRAEEATTTEEASGEEAAETTTTE